MKKSIDTYTYHYYLKEYKRRLESLISTNYYKCPLGLSDITHRFFMFDLPENFGLQRFLDTVRGLSFIFNVRVVPLNENRLNSGIYIVGNDPAIKEFLKMLKWLFRVIDMNANRYAMKIGPLNAGNRAKIADFKGKVLRKFSFALFELLDSIEDKELINQPKFNEYIQNFASLKTKRVLSCLTESKIG